MEAYAEISALCNTINGDALLMTMVAALGLVAALRKVRMMKKNNTRPMPPEAAGAWPVVGHLRLLGGPDLPHKTLGAMADKYGPIFVIRIGSSPTVAISSSEAAREIFTTNDKIWASKPTVIAAMKHMGYDTAMYGFSPYGPYFRAINKIVVQQLLSNRRLISGKRCFVGDEDEVSRRYQKALSNFFRLVAVFVPSDAIPILRGWIDLGGYEEAKEIRRRGGGRGLHGCDAVHI
ncbi:cytochrome P450 82C2-like [Papaver somniferum]|uniref:cytochrome P450 82C2-like n=1 Tax=Papaver somniferum TaxID=3469 RepID=UPI000E6FD10E|nr:cytochrome P450 82C2-like [Papaver somniferum]